MPLPPPRPAPCLFLDADGIARMKRDVAANTPEWQQLAAASGAIVAQIEANNNDYVWGLSYPPAMALVWLLTGDPRTGAALTRSLRELTVASTDLSPDDYYGERSLVCLAAAAHWAWNLFDEALRTQINTWLMDMVCWLWPESRAGMAPPAWAIRDGAVDAPSFGIDYDWSNYFAGFLETTAAILLHVLATGHDAGTNTVTGAPRLPWLWDRFQARLDAHVRNTLTTRGAGGASPEGTGYDLTQYLGHLQAASLSVTGQPLLDPAFFESWCLWQIHQTTPGMRRFYEYGLQPRDENAGLYDYNRLRVCAVLPFVSDQKRRWLKAWLDRITPAISTNPTVVPWEFLAYDPQAPSEDYTAVLPTDYFDAGLGLMVRRSDWGPDADFWGCWMGPMGSWVGYGELGYLGNLLIWAGNDWLLRDGIMDGASGIDAGSAFANVLTLWDPAAGRMIVQGLQDPGPAGACTAHENAVDYGVFAGQGANAYVQPDGSRPVTDWRRTVVHVPSLRLWVLHDAVTADPSMAKLLSFHAVERPAVAGTRAVWEHSAARMTLDALTPGASFDTIEEDMGPNGAPSSQRLQVQYGGDASVRSLVTLQAGFLGTEAPEPVRLAVTGAFDGVRLGPWAVLVGQVPEAGGTVAYDPGPAVHHLIVGLAPGATTTLPGGTVLTASDQGVLPLGWSGPISLTFSAGTVVTPPPPPPPPPPDPPPLNAEHQALIKEFAKELLAGGYNPIPFLTKLSGQFERDEAALAAALAGRAAT